jgi:diaminopimelate decarboxylase
LSIISELNIILHSKIIDNQISLGDLLFENNIKLIIEPGFALSTTAGITIMDVIGVKETSCSAKLVQVDGHIFSISSNMIEHLSDPQLIFNGESSNKKFEGYIIGSLCREDDFIMKRKITFPKEPKVGDRLVFFNTGSYAMSYERCNPQRFEEAKYFTAKKVNGKWELENDN